MYVYIINIRAESGSGLLPLYTSCRGRAMSLAHALAQTLRPKLPDRVLRACLDADQVVVDNIALVALEFVPMLNLPLSTVAKREGTYELRIPITAESSRVSLSDMRGIQAHAPARIADVFLAQDKTEIVLCVSICNEANLIRFTELDVIRLHKRART